VLQWESKDSLDWLREVRFTGDIHAVPEGTPRFANEPILEVVAQGRALELRLQRGARSFHRLACAASPRGAASRAAPVHAA
jgi:nicotinate phosphoribosyltransferase